MAIKTEDGGPGRRKDPKRGETKLHIARCPVLYRKALGFRAREKELSRPCRGGGFSPFQGPSEGLGGLPEKPPAALGGLPGKPLEAGGQALFQFLGPCAVWGGPPMERGWRRGDGR